MNTDVLTTKVTEGIAVVTLGSAKRMYFDAERGDTLTESLQEITGDPEIRVVIVTGGTPGYFNRFSIPALIEFAEAGRIIRPIDDRTRDRSGTRPTSSHQFD